VLFPAMAFFISVTGFNLLGEGLRRLIDRGIFNTAVLLSWRVIAAATLITVASVYVIMTLGPAPSYQNLAQQVSRDDLMRHVEHLTTPEMNGRAIGSPEAQQAARYIAGELESYELSPPPGGWLQEASVTLARLAAPIELTLMDEDGQSLAEFTRLADYGESIERHGGSGQAEAPVTLVLFSPDVDASRGSRESVYARFKGLDLRGQIVMMLSGNAPASFDTEALIRGAEGVLVITNDVKPRNQVLSSSYLEKPTLPVLRIRPQVANQILAMDGLDVETLRAQAAQMEGTEPVWRARPLAARVRMNIQLEAPQSVTLYNVVGLLNGADANLADEVVIVSCHYDGWGRAPDGTLYPGANSNASGVATMLEIARLWQEQRFQPRRSVLFVAWAGGEMPFSGAHHFIQDRSFIGHYDITAVIHLDRLGSDDGNQLIVRKMGRQDRLFNLLVSSAERLDVQVSQGLALRHHYQRLFSGEIDRQLASRYGTLIVTWGDPEPALAQDTLDRITPAHLSRAAQVINLTLITAAHEPTY
ncbi:MAG TPA: M28 family peptidase, partial [Chloroflexi bacterium]|nr:M28 family peptidase [Chloroflexota bacterium]